MVPDATFEKHYRIGDLAEMWSLGRETIRKMLVNEPGVIRVRMGRRKTHTTYSVPASVAESIHRINVPMVPIKAIIAETRCTILHDVMEDFRLLTHKRRSIQR